MTTPTGDAGAVALAARARTLLEEYRVGGDTLWRRRGQAPGALLDSLRCALAGLPPGSAGGALEAAEQAIARLAALVAGDAPDRQLGGLTGRQLGGPGDRGARVQAGGVLLYQGRTLVRLTPSGHWVFPKGHVDPGESLRRTAERECEEETGVIARAGAYLGAFTFALDDRPLGDLAGRTYEVHMYALTLVALPAAFAAHDGVDAFLVPVREAHGQLSFDDYRRMLGRALALAGLASAMTAGG